MGKWIIIGALVGLIFSGCDNMEPWRAIVDQQKRVELFQSCLVALPAGPQSTKYNDWDEVVEACDSASYRQAIVGYTKDINQTIAK